MTKENCRLDACGCHGSADLYNQISSECTFSLTIAHLLPKSVETFPLKSISLKHAYYMSMNLMEVWYFGIKWGPDALLVW